MSALAIRRYIFWISYDGSRFPEMAQGSARYGTMELFAQTVSTVLWGPRTAASPTPRHFKFSPSSRTDSHVHAIRNSVVVQVPISDGILDDTIVRKERLLREMNRVSSESVPSGLVFRDMHSVSAGFCIRRNVSYRKYTYRLAVRKPQTDSQLINSPTTVCFTERNYAWMLPAGFNVENASQACNLFKGVHCMASFYKHSARDKRLEKSSPDTMRNILLVQIDNGTPHSMENDLYDYYNITVVAKSYLREQIRRMVGCIVQVAYGKMALEQIRFLLRNAHPYNFNAMHIDLAPPGGLFLTDVVYNSDHFLNPFPYFEHSWDYEL